MFRWSLIAAQLPGRTDNDVKNHWNTKLKKKLSGMGIDPVTHKPFSHLMAEIATTLAPPQAAHLAEAALGCFKDEVLHLLTKKPINFHQGQHSSAALGNNFTDYVNCKPDEKDATVEKIKFDLSKAIQHDPEIMPANKPWDSNATTSANFAMPYGVFPTMSGFQLSPVSFSKGHASQWSQSVCTGSTCTAMDQQIQLHEKLEAEIGDDSEATKEIRNLSNIFSSDCVVWDLPADDLINPVV